MCKRDPNGTSSGGSNGKPLDSGFGYKTRADSPPYGKPRVFFAAADGETEKYCEKVCEMLLKKQSCAVFFERPGNRAPGFPEYLNTFGLIVIAVTEKFLGEDPEKLKSIVDHAKGNNIPVLPLMMENGLEMKFNEACGALHTLNINRGDSFEKALSDYLKRVLIGDEIIERIKSDAFDGYIFLSYRKKDIESAKELIRLIRGNEFCQNIAVWFDEYLIAGENFNDDIANALKKSELFALAVTPNLNETGNYVMEHEYPQAHDNGKVILPTELVPTDRAELETNYHDIPDCIPADEQTFSEKLLEALESAKINTDPESCSPERTYLIGCAYFNGIDVEVDKERGVKLITKAAESGLPEAIKRLMEMYNDGNGVDRSLDKIIEWSSKLAAIYESRLDGGSVDDVYEWCFCQMAIVDALTESFKSDEALPITLSVIEKGEQALETADSDKIKRILPLAYHKVGAKIRTEAADNPEKIASGDPAKARILFRKAYDMLMSLDELSPKEINGAAHDLIEIANTFSAEKEFDKAEEYYLKAIKFREEHQSESVGSEADVLLPHAYVGLGEIYMRREGYALAEDYLQKGAKLGERTYKETGFHEAAMAAYTCYFKLGECYSKTENLDNAENAYREAYELGVECFAYFPSANSKILLAASVLTLGDILEKEEKTREAFGLYMSVLGLKGAFTDNPESLYFKVCFLERVGYIALDCGLYEIAEKHFNEAEEIRSRLYDETGSDAELLQLAEDYVAHGKVYFRQKDFDNMIPLFKNAVNVSDQIYNDTGEPEFLARQAFPYFALGVAYMSKGNELLAEKCYQKVRDLYLDLVAAGKGELFDKATLTDAYEGWADIYRFRGDRGDPESREKATELLEACIQTRLTELMDKIDRTKNLWAVVNDYINIGYMAGNIHDAIASYNNAKDFCGELPDTPRNRKLYNAICGQLSKLQIRVSQDNDYRGGGTYNERRTNAMFDYKARENSNPVERPHIFFTCEYHDADRYREEVCGKLLEKRDCTVAFQCPENRDPNFVSYLSNFSLIVIAVTERFLSWDPMIRDTIFKRAKECSIPVLALMMEDGLESKFGELCDYYAYTLDYNAKNFDDALLSYLDTYLISDGLINKIKAAILKDGSVDYNANTLEQSFLLGCALLNGIGGDIDRTLGVRLITDAANAGLEEAMVTLLAMYGNGTGVPRSTDNMLELAKMLLNKFVDERDLEGVCRWADFMLSIAEIPEIHNSDKVLSIYHSIVDAEERALDTISGDKIKAELAYAYRKAGEIFHLGAIDNPERIAAGDLNRAREFYVAAYNLLLTMDEFEAKGLPGAVQRLIDIANTYLMEKNSEKAEEFFQRTIKLRKERGSKEYGLADASLPYAYSGLALIQMEQHHFDESEKLLKAGAVIGTEAYEATGEFTAAQAASYCYDKLGDYYSMANRLSDAEGAYGMMAAIGESCRKHLPCDESDQMYTDAALELGRVLERAGKTNEALNLYGNIGEIPDIFSENIESRRNKAEFAQRIGSILLTRGEFEKAVGYIDAAGELYDALVKDVGYESDALELVECVLLRANIFGGMGEYDNAIGLYEQGISFYSEKFKQTNDPAFLARQAQPFYLLGCSHFNKNDLSTAEACFLQVASLYKMMTDAGINAPFDKNVLITANERLAQIYINAESWEEVRQLLYECVSCRRTELVDQLGEAENLRNIVDDYINIGYTFYREGNKADALTSYNNAKDFCDELLGIAKTQGAMDQMNIICRAIVELS